MKTALAVVVAIALIGGALYARSTYIEGDPDPVVGATDQPVASGGDLVVACDAVLGTACPEGAERLDLDGLLAAFEAQPARHDVLVAPSAVVELIEQSRTSRATFATDRPVVAVTPIVLATAVAVDELVADACPTVTWTCAADMVRAAALSPAIPDPRRSTIGLAAFAALTGGFLGTPTYSTNVLGGSDFFTWIDAVQQQVPTASDPLNDLILFGGARNTGAITTEAIALDALGRAATNVPDLHWPTPLAALQVVAVGVDGADPDAVRNIGEATGRALQTAGWRPPEGSAIVDDSPPVDLAAPGLPAGGVLFTLRDRWG